MRRNTTRTVSKHAVARPKHQVLPLSKEFHAHMRICAQCSAATRNPHVALCSAGWEILKLAGWEAPR